VQNFQALDNGKPCIDHRWELAGKKNDIFFYDSWLKPGNVFKQVFGFLFNFIRRYSESNQIGSNSRFIGSFHFAFSGFIFPVGAYPLINWHDQASIFIWNDPGQRMVAFNPRTVNFVFYVLISYLAGMNHNFDTWILCPALRFGHGPERQIGSHKRYDYPEL